MDDISELLLGPQHPSSSPVGTLLALIAIVLAGALLGYLLWCYLREARIRRRIARRAHQRHGGNVVPAEAMPGAGVISDTRRWAKKTSPVLPPPHRASGSIKVRRHRVHPWKHNRFSADSAAG